jgi:hypothetical protein
MIADIRILVSLCGLGLPMGIAIALAVANKHVFEAVIKFGFRAIAHSSKTDAIAFFRFSRKAIAFSARSAQVKAIAPSLLSDRSAIASILMSAIKKIAAIARLQISII